MIRPDDPSETLAREAATWFARMRGPDADNARGKFDAWLARGPDHRAAYNRAGEVFALGKLLAEDPNPVVTKRSWHWRTPLATALVCLLAVGIWFGVRPPATQVAQAQRALVASSRILVTEPGEERLAQLDDGSTVRLSGDSRVSVQFGAAKRILTLLQGSARFDVHHERRPFIVLAGGGSVTARGTLFDVTLTREDQVEVKLLRGAIDVQLPGRSRGNPAPIRRLEAGESIAYLVPLPSSSAIHSLDAATLGPAKPEEGDIRDLDGVPVRLLLSDANRDAARPIRLAGADLGEQRVSGRLRVDDTEKLARRLSTLFGWSVDTHDPKEIVLKP